MTGAADLDYEKLLRGVYELEGLPKNLTPESPVPDYAYNILNRLGLLYRPVADEHYLANGGKRPEWPGGKRFAVCLTHDVDEVSLYSFRESLRYKEPKRAKIRRLLRVLSEPKDPLHCYERWLEIERQANVHSTFFFWPGISAVTKQHTSDCLYELSDSVVFHNERCAVTEMIEEIDRKGWEIGLHASWYSFDDVDELKRQKETLEKVVGHEIESVRHHYLHYDIRVTPRIHAQAGLKYDSTLGFNDNIGFRFGTSYPWCLYDLENHTELTIFEIPLIIQDTALLRATKGMRLDEDMAFLYMKQLIDEVEKVGGVVTLLWHPNYITSVEYWDLYCQALLYIKEKDPWFSTVRGIGEWWTRDPRLRFRQSA